MKKWIVLVVALGWMSMSMAQSPFEKGNAAYQTEAFEQAISWYEQALKEPVESSEVYFNLANAHYKLGHVAPSIYYYEKALLLSPNDETILSNLHFAQQLQIDEVKAENRVGFGKFFYDFAHWISYDAWAKWAIAFSVLGLVLFALYYLSAKSLYKRIGFTGMFIAFALLIICTATAYAVQEQLANENPAVVFARKAEVKAEPIATASTVFPLHEGTKVWVLDELENFYKIELADGKSGWISQDALRLVKE